MLYVNIKLQVRVPKKLLLPILGVVAIAVFVLAFVFLRLKDEPPAVAGATTSFVSPSSDKTSPPVVKKESKKQDKKPLKPPVRSTTNKVMKSETIYSSKKTGEVIWEEDFARYSATSPNPVFWNVSTREQPIYNQELQKYDADPKNVRVEGGSLVLQANQTPSGYTSGRVDTKGKVKIVPNTRLEARIKLPKGKGVWPAFWLLSDNLPYTTPLSPTDADWQSYRFYLRDGEIDIMEYYGSNPGVVESTIHTFSKSSSNSLFLNDGTFHNYWMEWTDSKIILGVDNQIIHTYSSDLDIEKWPFTNNNQMYLILNLALGGSGGGEVVRSPQDSWKMEVSSLRYSKL